MTNKKLLSAEQQDELMAILKKRFENNKKRHKDIEWDKVEAKLKNNSEKLWSLNEMEQTGGEPDVVGYNKTTNEYLFYDCVAESPKERRSLCYDQKALEARKEYKPENSAVNRAEEMGISLLTEEEYRNLQLLGRFDTKTSSWLQTPEAIRKLGGAIFGDCRYDTVFIYHNGVQSYYASRGFRGVVKI